MSSASTEFHKIWIEQCAATEDIREQFGQKNAMDYLIGEKLFAFVMASEEDPEFAAELPAFVVGIRWLFAASEINEYLAYLEHREYLAPPEPDVEMEDLDDEPEENLGWRAPSGALKNCCGSRASDNSFIRSSGTRSSNAEIQMRRTIDI